MRLKNIVLLTGMFLFVLGSSVKAQDLISVNDLNKAIMKKSVVVIDARSTAKFKADAHIKNAVNVPYKNLQQTTPVDGVLKSSAEIAKILGAAGVDGKKPIVVYDEGSSKYAGRLYWILKYMGVTNVKMLDGNIKAWKAGRKPITKNPTMSKKTTFTPAVNASILATMADVKKAGVVIIDSRSAAEFNGTDGKSKGHIPGAINIEYKQLLNDNATLKSAADLAKVFSGVDKGKTVILYCDSGVRTGSTFLALTTILGYTKVKVYDGALNEWNVKNNKVDK